MDTTCVFKSEIKFFIKQTCLSIYMLKNMISLNVYDGRKCKIKKISHVSRRSNCRHEVFQSQASDFLHTSAFIMTLNIFT